MLSRCYIEALLVDPDRADDVWQAWDSGQITDAESERAIGKGQPRSSYTREALRRAAPVLAMLSSFRRRALRSFVHSL